MAVLTTPNVLLILQADAPLTVDATNQFKIRKIRIVAAAAVATAIIQNGAAGEVFMLSAPINGTDEIDFSSMSFPMKGLIVSAMAGAGGKLYIYTM